MSIKGIHFTAKPQSLYSKQDIYISPAERSS